MSRYCWIPRTVPARLLPLLLLAATTLCLGASAVEEPIGDTPMQGPLFEADFDDVTGTEGLGTLHGAVAFVDVRGGNCASFDGQSWIDTGISQEALGSEFTVECWVNPAAQQNRLRQHFRNHLGEGVGFVLQQDGAGTNQFMAAYGAGENHWVLNEAVPLAADRWQHVALVKTRAALRLYLNGIIVAEMEDAAPARPSPMAVAGGARIQ